FGSKSPSEVTTDAPAKPELAKKPGVVGSKPSTSADDEPDEEEEEEADAPPVPVSPKPGLFGARQSSPFGKQARDSEPDEADNEDQEEPPSAPISKPSPYGSRPSSSAKGGEKGQSKGAASRPFDVTPATSEDESVKASKQGSPGALAAE